MVILLVDSDKEALDLEKKRLTKQQFAVTASLYSRADDALLYAMYHDVDIVFTRDVLDGMTGQELVEKIHRFKPDIECHIFHKNEEIPFCRFLKTRQSPFCTRSGEEEISGAKDEEKEIKDSESNGKGHRRFMLLDNFRLSVQKRREKQMTGQELRSLNRRELLEIMIEQGKELETSKEKYNKDLKFLKSTYEKEINALKTGHEKEVQALKEKNKKEISEVKEKCEKEKESLRAELEQAHKATRTRDIALDEAGSIAVAALQLNGVFEAAQAASQQYIENIRSLSDRQAAICARRDAENKAEIERKLAEATAKCAEMESACRRKCRLMEAEAKRKSDDYWAEVSRRLQSFYENHQELKKLLGFSLKN